MPKFLEDQLRAEYGAKSAIPYKVMNAEGVMHGSKETAKGRAMEAKHERDTSGQSNGRSGGAARAGASTRSHVDRGHRNVKNPQKHALKLKHG